MQRVTEVQKQWPVNFSIKIPVFTSPLMRQKEPYIVMFVTIVSEKMAKPFSTQR